MNHGYSNNGVYQNGTNESAIATIQREYRLEKVLAKRKDDFLRDFSFVDIRHDLEKSKILPYDDIRSINQLSTERERIEKLFFLITYKCLRYLDEFLRILKEKYDWLASAIQGDISDHPPHSGDDYLDDIRELRKEIPRHVDYNIHRCESVSRKGDRFTSKRLICAHFPVCASSCGTFNTIC